MTTWIVLLAFAPGLNDTMGKASRGTSACLESATDRWREQHRHALGLAIIPRCDEAAGIFEHFGFGRALRGPPWLLLGLGSSRSTAAGSGACTGSLPTALLFKSI
jgi:hypothetical protein